MRPSLYLWLPWSTNQSGGDCFMHQTSPSGQMSSFSPTLLFSLPVSNGKLEWTFSQVNLIKSRKRSSLRTDTLSNLLVINADKTSLKEFSPDSAINLWWNAKTRKPTHGPRASCAPQDQSSVDCDSDEEAELILDDWINV